MNPKTLSGALALNRTLIGLALTLAPRHTGVRWIGPDAERRGAQLMTRGLGARDIALGLGSIRALARSESVRPWLIGGLLADAVDLLATVAVAQSLPRKARAFGIAMTGGSTAVGGWLAWAVE